ncbi:hypothetical protein Hanom_Chr00s001102g01673851 [Helianthus anomalus]
MYKMNGSDKLYSDKEFPIENINVDKVKNIFKLVEIDVSEVEGLSSSMRFSNFQHDKAYYNKPSVPPRFHNNNQNGGFGVHQGGMNYQKENFQKLKFVKRTTFVKSSSSMTEQQRKKISKANEEFFAEKKASQLQTDVQNWVVDTRKCFQCDQIGHIA